MEILDRYTFTQYTAGAWAFATMDTFNDTFILNSHN